LRTSNEKVDDLVNNDLYILKFCSFNCCNEAVFNGHLECIWAYSCSWKLLHNVEECLIILVSICRKRCGSFCWCYCSLLTSCSMLSNVEFYFDEKDSTKLWLRVLGHTKFLRTLFDFTCTWNWILKKIYNLSWKLE